MLNELDGLIEKYPHLFPEHFYKENTNMSFLTKLDPEFIQLLQRTASENLDEASVAMAELAKAIELPLREGIMASDIASNIYKRIAMPAVRLTESPLDYVMVPTYKVANSIDWLLCHVREARWDVVARAIEVLEAGFVKKMNDDGWHTILAAGVDRNIVYDSDVDSGQFTKRLVSLMKTVMRGNSTSNNRAVLTDLYLSPKALEDIRKCGLDQVDVLGVNLHALDELGEGQEYQTYYTDSLGGTLGPNSDVELVVGLDLTANDSFVMPVKQEVTVLENPMLDLQQRAGLRCFAEVGFGVLDNRRVVLGSF